MQPSLEVKQVVLFLLIGFPISSTPNRTCAPI
jgi:hypothetical protein